MIPVKADAKTQKRYVRNILSTYRRASEDQHMRGMAWYRTAHQLAEMISDGDARMGAGVIAALSANKSWKENVKLATEACGSGKPAKHFKDAIRKATMILNGADPADVLPMSSKTGQFFLCIAEPDNDMAVCIDRHAHDVAVGERYGDRDRGLGSKGRYSVLSDAYREAARIAGILPQEMQAITWVVQVESK